MTRPVAATKVEDSLATAIGAQFSAVGIFHVYFRKFYPKCGELTIKNLHATLTFSGVRS